MSRNSRHFDTEYDVLAALEEVLSDAMEQDHPKLDPEELVAYIDTHFSAEGVLDYRQDAS